MYGQATGLPTACNRVLFCEIFLKSDNNFRNSSTVTSTSKFVETFKNIPSFFGGSRVNINMSFASVNMEHTVSLINQLCLFFPAQVAPLRGVISAAGDATRRVDCSCLLSHRFAYLLRKHSKLCQYFPFNTLSMPTSCIDIHRNRINLIIKQRKCKIIVWLTPQASNGLVLLHCLGTF